MAFKDWQVDEKINVHDRLTHFNGNSINALGDVGVILYIDEVNIILSCQGIVAVDFEGTLSGVTNPRALNN